jgi:hypothetical protein
MLEYILYTFVLWGVFSTWYILKTSFSYDQGLVNQNARKLLEQAHATVGDLDQYNLDRCPHKKSLLRQGDLVYVLKSYKEDWNDGLKLRLVGFNQEGFILLEGKTKEGLLFKTGPYQDTQLGVIYPKLFKSEEDAPF